MSWHLSFNETLPTWATFFALVVSPDEPSRVRVTGPMDEVPEIGSYSTQLERTRAEELLQVVEASGYRELAKHEKMMPETPTFTMGKRQSGKDGKREWIGFPLPTLPPELVPVRQAVRRVAQELRGHPLHVVRGEAAWAVPTFKPRGTLELVITLSNPGRGPVELLSPNAPPTEQHPGQTSRTITVLKVGNASGKDVEQVELEPEDIEQIDHEGKRMAPTERVRLAPGEKARFRLKKRVYLSPGSYRGTVTLRVLDRLGVSDERAVGVLLLKAGAFEVKGWLW